MFNTQGVFNNLVKDLFKEAGNYRFKDFITNITEPYRRYYSGFY